MTISELCMTAKRAVKCSLGLHEPSEFVTVSINGIEYQVCRWCLATIKPPKNIPAKLGKSERK